MENEQIEAYLKILDERTRSIMENNEDAFRIVREAKEKLDYFDKTIENMRSMLDDSSEKGNLDDKHEELEILSKRLDKLEFKMSESMDEIKQSVKLHDNLINTTRKRLDNQGTSDVKLLKYDAKMRNALIGQVVAVALSFIVPFTIIYFSIQTDKFSWLRGESVVEEKTEPVETTVKKATTKAAIKNVNENETKNVNKKDETEKRDSQVERKPKIETKTEKKVESNTNLRETETIYTDKEIQQ